MIKPNGEQVFPIVLRTCPCGKDIVECKYSVHGREEACPSFEETNHYLNEIVDRDKIIAALEAENKRLKSLACDSLNCSLRG